MGWIAVHAVGGEPVDFEMVTGVFDEVSSAFGEVGFVGEEDAVDVEIEGGVHNGSSLRFTVRQIVYVE